MWIRMLVLVSALGVVATAQDFDSAEKKFYEDYKNLLDVNDLAGVNTLARRNMRTAVGVLDALLSEHAKSPSDANLDHLRPLAAGMDQRDADTRYQKRIEYIATLTEEDLERREKALEVVRKTDTVYDEARQTRDAGLYRRAIDGYEESLTDLERLSDREFLAHCRQRVGSCHEFLEAYQQAVTAYDRAMDDWLAAGISRENQDYKHMSEKRRDWIDMGFDPEASTDEAIEGSRDTPNSFVPTSEWQDWSTSYKKAKSPTQFETPSPYSVSHILLWRRVAFLPGSLVPLSWPDVTSVCSPFGVPLNLYRDGAKGLIDVDGDGEGDVEAKVIANKASVTEISNGKGRDAEKYALFFATGSATERWLGFNSRFTENCYFRSGCYREGKVLGQKFILIDDNCSGIFGDVRESSDFLLNGAPQFADLDAMLVGKGSKAAPFSTVFQVGDAFHRLRVKNDGGVSTRELAIDTGFVKLEWEGARRPSALVIGEVGKFQGAYFDVSGKDEVEVPVGRYKVAVGKIEKGKGRSLEMAWIMPGEAEPFEVKAGETYSLEMGAPFRFTFETRDLGNEVMVDSSSMLVYEKTGAMIGRIFPNVLLPEVAIKSDSGSTLAKGEKGRLISQEVYLQSIDRAWFPADFVVSKPGGTSCTAQMTLKSHKLLGGPFTSEWQ